MLSHPNVVPILDVTLNSQYQLFVVSELCPYDLREMISNSKEHMTEDEVLSIFTSVALALENTHHCGDVHRNLRTEHIFFTANGEVKVGSFGNHRVMSYNGDHSDIPTNEPRYMAPEMQAGHRKWTMPHDIWALGVVLFEMCSLRLMDPI